MAAAWWKSSSGDARPRGDRYCFCGGYGAYPARTEKRQAIKAYCERSDSCAPFRAGNARLETLELVARENVNQLAVISDGSLQGIFSRAQVLQFLQFHSGIGEDSQNRAA